MSAVYSWDSLSLLAPRLSPVLVGPEQLTKIRACLRYLPEDFTSYWGFECRLAERAEQVDVQFSVNKGSAGHHMLAGCHAEAGLASELLAQPAWRRIQQFASAWLEGKLPDIPTICLGADLNVSALSVPGPLLHLRTDRVAPEAIEELLALLPGPMVTDSTAAILSRTVKTEACELVYLGSMMARQTGALRLTVRVPVAEALPYLKSIGWLGDTAHAGRVLGDVAAWTSHVGLSLNLGAAVEPYLGLEFLNWSKPLATRAQWRACLAALVEQGLCSAAKREALLAYEGMALARPPAHEGARVPNDTGSESVGADSVAAASHALPPVRTVAHKLLHLKLVLRPHRTLEAKAYLDVQQGWLHGNLGRESQGEVTGSHV